MSGLASLVAGHTAPGVFRWHAAFEADQVRHAVEHAGWAFGRVDGWVAQSRAEVLAAIGAALSFPDHYGRNLDALWDCLTELGGPTVLLWDGWATLARVDEPAFDAVLAVLAERCARPGPPFAVLLRGDGPEIEIPSLD